VFINPENLLLADMLLKLAGHPEDRLLERTELPPEVLVPVREGLRGKHLPSGSNHVRLPGGGYVVLKDVSKRNNPRHVVATVLASEMSPPGYDVTLDVMDRDPDDVKIVNFKAGKNKRTGESYRAKTRSSPNSKSFTETHTLSSVKVSSVNKEAMRENLKELTHNPDSLRHYADLIRRESKVIHVSPGDLPLIPHPPNDSDVTRGEVAAVLETMDRSPLPDRFVDRVSDSVEEVFFDACDQLGVEAYTDLADAIAKDVLKIAMYLKFKFLRPRPYQLAPYYEGYITSADMAADESPSYPSGHSMMGFALSKFYEDRHPEHSQTFNDLGRKVALARVQAGVHYPSDVVYAKQLVEHLMGPSEPVKEASLMGAAIGGAVAGGDAKQRAAGAAGGAAGGTVGGIAGLAGGVALARPLGLTPQLEGKTMGEIIKSPLKSTKALGGKGLGLVLGLNTLGAVTGGLVGGKMGGNAYKNRVKTPNIDRAIKERK
jgi:hypothetical protein